MPDVLYFSSWQDDILLDIKDTMTERMSGRARAGVMLLLLMLASSGQALSNLPNHTELMVSVLADRSWVGMEALTLDEVETILTESITGSRSEHVSMKMAFNEMVPGNITDNIDTGQSHHNDYIK